MEPKASITRGDPRVFPFGRRATGITGFFIKPRFGIILIANAHFGRPIGDSAEHLLAR